MPLVLAEGQPVEGRKRAREEAPQRQLALLELLRAIGVYGDGDRCVEEPLAAPVHLVSEAGHVLEGYLRLRRGRSPAPQRQRGRRLHLDLLPLQGPCRLGGGDGRNVQRHVHRDAQRQHRLKVSRRQGAGPPGQMKGLQNTSSDLDAVASEGDGQRPLLVGHRWRAARQRGPYEGAQRPVSQREDGESRS